MEDITLLVDYKGHFGTKHGGVPYRSGLDREKIARYFQERGYRATFVNFCDVDFQSRDLGGRCFLYTSAEDHDLHYRSFIEDIVLGLEHCGARIIPTFKFLRAHHNKVFMEILRDQLLANEQRSLRSRFYGTLEELEARLGSDGLPSVIKPASGSMSVGVRLCERVEDLPRAASRVSSSRHWPTDAWDFGRMWRRKGYVRNSLHRRKFVVQPFLPGLENDWKVLIYGKKYYVLMRRTRKHDFRASGSGRFEFIKEPPAGLLDFASSVFSRLDLPHLSMDLGAVEGRFHLFEFQALYFGTLTIEEAPFHFARLGQEWKRVDGPSIVEEEFVRSVVDYLPKMGHRPRPGGSSA
mgnify:CR=1 FL=1